MLLPERRDVSVSPVRLVCHVKQRFCAGGTRSNPLPHRAAIGGIWFGKRLASCEIVEIAQAVLQLFERTQFGFQPVLPLRIRKRSTEELHRITQFLDLDSQPVEFFLVQFAQIRRRGHNLHMKLTKRPGREDTNRLIAPAFRVLASLPLPLAAFDPRQYVQ